VVLTASEAAGEQCPVCQKPFEGKVQVDPRSAWGTTVPPAISLAGSPGGKASRSCCLCGTDAILVPFYLRTLSSRREGSQVVTRWYNFPAECCQKCFATVSGLQTAKLLLMILGFGPLIVVGVLFILSGGRRRGPQPPAAEALTMPMCGTLVLMLVCLLGLLVIWSIRRGLVNSPHLTYTLDRLKQAHQIATGDTRIKVIPLARVSEGGSFFEADQ
jgi:hypothetical protein